MRIQKSLIWVALLILVASSVAGCGATATPSPTKGTTPVPKPPTATPAPKLVDEIVVAQLEEAPTLDPHLNWTMGARNIYYQIFGYLTLHDEKMNVVGELAESWELIGDRSIKYKLRKGVKFHNGEPFNAQVVKYSIERIQDPNTKSPWSATLKPITKVEVVDEYTVLVTAEVPTTALLLEVGRMAMVPPKYIAEKGAAYFAENPVGTGPWKFVEWVRGDRVVLERYMDYWAGPSRIKRVVFKVVPEETTRVSELLAGRTDIAKIPPQAYSQLQASKVAHPLSAPSVQTIRIDFLKGTDDLHVRKAIAYAITVDSIIKNLMEGRARRVKGAMSPPRLWCRSHN